MSSHPFVDNKCFIWPAIGSHHTCRNGGGGVEKPIRWVLEKTSQFLFRNHVGRGWPWKRQVMMWSLPGYLMLLTRPNTSKPPNGCSGVNMAAGKICSLWLCQAQKRWPASIKLHSSVFSSRHPLPKRGKSPRHCRNSAILRFQVALQWIGPETEKKLSAWAFHPPNFPTRRVVKHLRIIRSFSERPDWIQRFPIQLGFKSQEMTGRNTPNAWGHVVTVASSKAQGTETLQTWRQWKRGRQPPACCSYLVPGGLIQDPIELNATLKLRHSTQWDFQLSLWRFVKQRSFKMGVIWHSKVGPLFSKNETTRTNYVCQPLLRHCGLSSGFCLAAIECRLPKQGSDYTNHLARRVLA